MTRDGTIIAAHGRQYRVTCDDGLVLNCFPRGKRSELACGDRVRLLMDGTDQGVIEETLPRRSLLFRSDAFRQKFIAANVTQLIVVVATEPAFSKDLISRSLIAAEHQQLDVIIVLNKCDLHARVAAATQQLALFTELGYPVVTMSALTEGAALRPYLQDKASILLGQSGMGKSSFVNALIPEARAKTREISVALDSGKHTTTHATLYALDACSTLIDSPGLQEFGLQQLTPEDIAHGFRELRPLIGQCRFRNCQHDKEPDCVIRAAAQSGAIDVQRYALFVELYQQALANVRAY